MIRFAHLPRSIAALLTAVVVIGAAQTAAAKPVKLIPQDRFGWDVNSTTNGTVCALLVESCQAGHESQEPGGFVFPEAVAAGNGSYYVADQGNHRVEEFTSSGQFVLMFGREVNKLTKANVCVGEKPGECQAGTAGGGAGQFNVLRDIAIDSSGNVYVAENLVGKEGTENTFGERVQKFTANGVFVWEAGKEVNTTTKDNLCTMQEIAVCGSPKLETPQSREQKDEHDGFYFNEISKNLLADGGQERLYIGEEGRIQELEADGKWAAEILIPARAEAIAIDGTEKILYVAYGKTVHEFEEEGTTLPTTIGVLPLKEDGVVDLIVALAVDPSGHLAVVAQEQAAGAFGRLFAGPSGQELPTFAVLERSGAHAAAAAFDEKGALYIVDVNHDDVTSYSPESVAEVLTGGSECTEGMPRQTSITLECLLEGEVNPEGVEDTQAWFEWGRSSASGCSFGFSTSRQPLPPDEASHPVDTDIAELRPNETFCYQMNAVDEHVQESEKLVGGIHVLHTPVVLPKIVGEPATSFITSSSAVMTAELNPENTLTEYYFEYSPEGPLGEDALPGCHEESCPGVAKTGVSQSQLYGLTAVTLEATGLQPDTVYRYRLTAANQAGRAVTSGGQEGTFRTGAAPVVGAQTGTVSAITSTGAVVSGVVFPDGQPATYSFELGVYRGAATTFGTIASGPTGGGTESKFIALTGLQPATEYAYRIKIVSGYGTAFGAPLLFTTEGAPIVLVSPASLPMLSVPEIRFPKQPPSCKKGYVRNKHGKCVRTKKKTRSHQKALSKKARK